VELQGRKNRGIETVGGAQNGRSRESIAGGDFLGQRRA